MTKKKSKTAAKPKRTGPSKRTQAERDAINKRAAAWRPTGKKSKGEKPKRTITVAGQPTRWPREIKIGARHRKEMGDLVGLARSIDERGALLQPIVITPKDELIAGQRRLAAWSLTRFHKEPIPVCVVDIDAVVAGEWDENAKRKDFTPSECVSIMEALEPIARAAAKTRQLGGKKIKDVDEGLAGKGQAVDHLAAYVGKDRKTLTRAKEVVDAASRNPKKYGPLKEQMDKSGKVNGAWRRLQVHNQVEAIKKDPPRLPAGVYSRGVADMPWPYEPEDDKPAERGRATRPYATMSIKDMCAMPVQKMFAKDCVLFFWVTNFHMMYAYQVLQAWGFKRFPVIITWVKDQIGRGQWLRDQSEHCIIAVKGKPVWNLTAQSTVIYGPRREHSQKPDSFYALIDEVAPASKSLELFAQRELPEGWEGFGDRVGSIKDAAGPASSIESSVGDQIETNVRGRAKRPPAEAVAETQGAVDCRVCSYGTGLCADCVAAGEHEISVMVHNPVGAPTESVATCSCGFQCSVEYVEGGDDVCRNGQNVAIKAHWQNVVTEAKAAAASADCDHMPASLKRGADGVAPYQRGEAAK